MTEINPIKQQQSLRIGELAKIARQRYLESGGDPHRSANGNQWLNNEEKQEYLALARQVFDEQSIANYLKKHGTWRERFAATKAEIDVSGSEE
ncbi:hypothetical protein Ple7327_0677 [Pleurocapsa sp. PCC 7327]|uniref:hypothetical protein n=1 Tax=Pleurocapsa sp. PCC 7327 TaxID=118163 RepID=UPI00029FC942|nr:hypothetical protein [Pleurocapsa sp. PCC 7327]AFY76109.1 hypothetical protein Ple7327_0677 [Pleurocapsa sp. PCC 7327]